MCNCIDQIKANAVSDVMTKNNPSGAVVASWGSSAYFRVTNRQQRTRVIERPVLSLTLEYTQTTTKGKPFKRATVECITIKPIFCSQCGGKL